MIDTKNIVQNLGLDNLTAAEQIQFLDEIQKTIKESKAQRNETIKSNITVVIKALKKIEEDIKSRYDEVGKQISDRVASIKDGKDGRDGRNGRDGKDGLPGRDGVDGKDGLNGRDGKDGQDGISVTNASIDFDGSLVFYLSDGTEVNVGEIVPVDIAEKIKVINTMSTNAAVEIKDEGNVITSGVTSINFTGSGVTATASGDAVTVNVTGGGGGDVTGPASSTDNAIVRFDGTTGKLVQNSVVTIADTTGDIAGVGSLTTSGNIGVGTASPTTKLYVTGTGGVSSRGTFESTSATAGAPPTINFYRSSTTSMATQFVGQITFSRLLTDSTSNTAATITAFGSNIAGSAAGTIQSDVLTDYRWLIGSAEQARLTTTGLGIGTASPYKTLHVRAAESGATSTTSLAHLVVESNGATGLNILTPNTSSGYITFGDPENGSVGRIQYEHTANYMAMFVNNSERMRIDSSGNVGIGTTAPGGIIHAEVASGNAVIRSRTGGSGSAILILETTGIGAQQINANVGSVQNLTMTVAGSERLRIDVSGNVGIGTAGPGARLDITSPAAFTARFSGPANTYIDVTDGTGTFRAQILSNTPYLTSIGAYGMIFGTNNTERMRLTSTGNLGVGTSAAVNKLQVAGSFGRGAPVTKTGNFTLADTENWVICNGTGTITVTLPAASSWTGREFTIKTIAAFTVISNASNVVPLAGGATGTAILAATAGTWATLVSDGTNWIIMQA